PLERDLDRGCAVVPRRSAEGDVVGERPRDDRRLLRNPGKGALGRAHAGMGELAIAVADRAFDAELEAEERPEERGLAAARGADECDDLAGIRAKCEERGGPALPCDG